MKRQESSRAAPGRWEVIESRDNVYLDRFEGVSYGRLAGSMKDESHSLYMGHLPGDIDLRLAWGMTEATGSRSRA